MSVNESVETKLSEMQYQIDQLYTTVQLLGQENKELKDKQNALLSQHKELTETLKIIFESNAGVVSRIDNLEKELELLKSNDQVLHEAQRVLSKVSVELKEDYLKVQAYLAKLETEMEKRKNDHESNRIKLELAIESMKDEVVVQQKSLDNIIDSFGEILTKLHTLVEETENAKGNISGLETLYHCMGDQVDDLEKSVKKIKKKIKQNKLTLTLP